MTTWNEQKINELSTIIKSHKGYGESKEFYAFKQIIIQKIGTQNWEKMLKKAKSSTTKNKL